jgi:hypothetical protein
MDLTFNPTVNAVGFDVIGDLVTAVNVTIQIFGPGDTLLGTYAVAGSASGTFWGVISLSPIERISFVDPAGGGELIGNLQFGTVPVSIPTLNQIGLLALAFFLAAAALVSLNKRNILRDVHRQGNNLT